jgi:hypothetical protein
MRLALLAAALLLAGCYRTHMSPSFGAANRAAFAKQVIDPEAGSKAKPEGGLDSEEAAIISNSYRGSLAPAKKETARPPMLLITDEAAAKKPGSAGGK